jgi:hypothetical protein
MTSLKGGICPVLNKDLISKATGHYRNKGPCKMDPRWALIPVMPMDFDHPPPKLSLPFFQNLVPRMKNCKVSKLYDGSL